MKSSAPDFSPFTTSVLRAADRRLRACERGDAMTRYAACRSAACALASVDTFYIGHYLGPTTLSIPYCVDNKQFLSADVQQFGPRGMSAFIRTGEIYRYALDGGDRVRLGWSTTEHPVQDAVVVPLRRSDSGEVIGMMAVESVTVGAFDEEFVHAMEWLARALVWEMSQDREFAEDLGLYELYPELNSKQPRNEVEHFRLLSGELERLRLALQKIELPPSPELTEQRLLLDGAREAGERLHLLLVDTHQANVAENSSPSPESALTTRELEVATLIAIDGLSNRELASRLFISEKTVKVHVGNVLRKLGISQRSAIPFVLREIQPSHHR